LLAVADRESITLRDVATGERVGQLQGSGTVCCFSPGDNLLATGSLDGTVLLWEVSKMRPQPRTTGKLTREQMERLWNDLAIIEPSKSYPALWKLVGSSNQAAMFLMEHLRNGPAVHEEEMQELLAKLDSQQYAAREKAQKELERVVIDVEPRLRAFLRTDPPPEARHRVERVLASARSGAQFAKFCQQVRGVQALEYIGTAAARRHLQALANGPIGNRLTTEAACALHRLEAK
jgi:hypothetical protein